MEKRRVVITGMGAITPYGVGVETFWESVKNGKSGITYVNPPRIDAEQQTTHVYGVVPEYDESQYMDVKEAKRLDEFIKYALVASEEAMKQSGINMEEEDPYRVGCLISAAAGGHRTIEENHLVMLKRGFTKCSPFTVPAMNDFTFSL